MTGDGGTPVLEPDRRYWRRRVNRHVRNARRTRRFGRLAVIAAANLAVGAMLVATGASAIRHLTESPEFAVRNLDVRGCERTTPAALRAALSGFVGRNVFSIDLDDVARDAAGDPWVERAAVKRVLPDTLRVEIEERSPAANAMIGGLAHVVDGEGFVLGPAGPGMAYDLPVLTGLDPRQGKVLAAAIERGTTALAGLRDGFPEFAAGISEIDLSRDDRLVVATVDPGPRLALDPERPDRNLRDWLRLRDELTRRAGEIDTVDLRWDRRITLMPRETLVAKRSE